VRRTTKQTWRRASRRGPHHGRRRTRDRRASGRRIREVRPDALAGRRGRRRAALKPATRRTRARRRCVDRRAAADLEEDLVGSGRHRAGVGLAAAGTVRSLSSTICGSRARTRDRHVQREAREELGGHPAPRHESKNRNNEHAPPVCGSQSSSKKGELCHISRKPWRAGLPARRSSLVANPSDRPRKETHMRTRFSDSH